MAKEENAIVSYQDKYPVLFNPEAMLAVKENVGDSELTVFDLDKIKIPAGGGISWEIPTLSGEPDTGKEIKGVIVYQIDQRSYWATKFNGDNVPPDCSSVDCVHGVGEPGGQCRDCPFSVFGSEPEHKRGQACKQVRILFILCEGNILPYIIVAPPTSVKPIKQFMLRMASQGAIYYEHEVKLTLSKAKNKDGIDYSEIKPTLIGKLSPDAIAQVKSYREQIIKAVGGRMIVDQDDVTSGNTATA